MKKNFALVAAVMISGRLCAQQDSVVTSLDEVVVTASKFEQKQSQTGKVVTVIGKDQLEKYAGRGLSQLLNDQASLAIGGALNNMGSVQTVFMRGASSGRTLILIDGIPVNDPSMINNEFDLNLIPVTEIERIEICKGAQSTLYGSDAIAGVINIITIAKDINRPFTLKADMALGNKNSMRDNIQVAGKLNRLVYNVRFAKLSTDGFSSAHDASDQGGFDRDGYDGNTIHADMRYQLLSSLSASAFIEHSQYSADVDAGPFTDDRDFTIRNANLASGAGLQFKKGIVTVVGNYRYNEIARRYLNDSTHVPGFTIYERNQYHGRAQFGELYASVRVRDWLTVLAGSDYRWGNMNQQYFSVSGFGPFSSAFGDTSTHQVSYYASLSAHFLKDRLNVELGARSNRHSRFGNNSTYTFNPSFAIDRHWRIFGSIATGFKAPSIYQLFDAFSGNVDLEPEKSTNYEFGIQQQHGTVSSRLVYFHRNIRNAIDFDYIDSKYFNFVRQSVNGLEVELAWKPVEKLSVAGNYTLIKGREETQSRKDFNDTTYRYLLRRPANSINLAVAYRFCQSFNVSVGVKSVGVRHDVGGFMTDDVLLKKYSILNAYAEYRVNAGLKLFIDAQNLTGKRFYDQNGYNSIPFLVNGGINLRF